MTFRYRLTAPIAATCLAATLAACSNPSPEAGRPDSVPPPSPTGMQSATTSPSLPPDTAPVRPTAAVGLSLASADSFVRYYSEILNYASTTGDTSSLLSESDAGCGTCKEYADFVKKSNAANGLLSGDYREKVADISELAKGDTGRAGGTAKIQVGEYVSRATPGASPFMSDPRTYTRTFALAPRGNNWIMFEMTQVEQ